jgi:hypothetical protein
MESDSAGEKEVFYLNLKKTPQGRLQSKFHQVKEFHATAEK